MISIFTPTYNRGYILPELYASLCRQTCRDFEWLVVDDGSTDNTEALVQGWMSENKINLRYIRQDNGGKHIAINRGVKEAKGELFFIVDSDDRLTDDAVEWIAGKSAETVNNTELAGISGLRIHPNGEKIGGGAKFNPIVADAIEIREKYHITGDLAEVYKTSVLRKFPFPEIEGEKFCSEGLIWNRIAMAGLKLKYYYKPLYVCSYLEDGLTASRIKCRINSPHYSMLLYSEGLKYKGLNIKTKIKYGILYWRYSQKANMSLTKKIGLIKPIYWLLMIPGMLLRYSNK